MKIDIKALPEFGEQIRGEDPPEVMDLQDEKDLTIQSPLRYDMHVQLCGDELIARGALEIDVAFNCVRCTKAFTTAICEPAYDGVVNVLADLETGETLSREQSHNMDPPQFVDLTPDMRESILLAFPAHPVCNAGCKGLCPQCGANWNQAPCDCSEPTDDRWDALDRLDIESKE